MCVTPRVLIITDRTELDEQIEKVFKGVSEEIYRTKSGADLVRVLNASDEWLICSLIHKFGASTRKATSMPSSRTSAATCPKDFRAKGDIFVFVDECHRTQSGKMHDAMKALLPGAMFIGFTGTPLLKSDKQTQHRDLRAVHPHLQVRRGGAGRRRARPALRGARHRPGHHLAGEGRPVVRGRRPRADRHGQGPAQAALGHDAEGAERAGPAGEDRRRHPAGHGDSRPR